MKYLRENMNIALIHDWITNVAGAERVLLELIELYPEADIYTSVYDPSKAAAFNKYKINTTYLQRSRLFKQHRELLVPYTPLAFESLDLSKYDLVITNTTFPAKGIITSPDTLHICYCHTPTRYLWEPENDNRASRGVFSILRKNVAHKLRIWDRVAAERPDYYLANSKTVKSRIHKYYRRDARVVYPPVDINKFEYNKDIKPEKYYLFVSRLIKYKRADLAVEAFNKLGLPLKIIGTGPEEGRLKKLAAKNIEFLGRVSDSELIKYYSGAQAFIFAAEEDFGIVPVEAMACGRPVIAYGTGGAAETVINGITGLLFKPQSVDALILAVKKFDPEDFDSAIIRKHAENYSIEKFKKEFARIVEELSVEFYKNQT